jgi:hypothetical protein
MFSSSAIRFKTIRLQRISKTLFGFIQPGNGWWAPPEPQNGIANPGSFPLWSVQPILSNSLISP